MEQDILLLSMLWGDPSGAAVIRVQPTTTVTELKTLVAPVLIGEVSSRQANLLKLYDVSLEELNLGDGRLDVGEDNLPAVEGVFGKARLLRAYDTVAEVFGGSVGGKDRVRLLVVLPSQEEIDAFSLLPTILIEPPPYDGHEASPGLSTSSSIPRSTSQSNVHEVGNDIPGTREPKSATIGGASEEVALRSWALINGSMLDQLRQGQKMDADNGGGDVELFGVARSDAVIGLVTSVEGEGVENPFADSSQGMGGMMGVRGRGSQHHDGDVMELREKGGFFAIGLQSSRARAESSADQEVGSTMGDGDLVERVEMKNLIRLGAGEGKRKDSGIATNRRRKVIVIGLIVLIIVIITIAIVLKVLVFHQQSGPNNSAPNTTGPTQTPGYSSPFRTFVAPGGT
ncbi:hypothetical protein HDV00_003496 [Rhizophlyctis rosea]|nr:hypothetical protein HDV00_003496 [Rhizophlyctis rosea]